MGRDRNAEFRCAVIRLRSATESDAAAIAAIYAPFVDDTWVSFEEIAPTPDEIAQRIRALDGRLPWLVADCDGTLAGYAYASEHRARAGYRWSVDVSAYLDERFRRRGIATRLYTALFEILIAQGYANALAGIALPNDASVGFHVASGFASIGIYHHIGFKAGAWHDVQWLERELASRAVPPRDPLPLRALASEAIGAILGR